MKWEEMSYNRYNDRNDELWDERDEVPNYIIDEEELEDILLLSYIID